MHYQESRQQRNGGAGFLLGLACGAAAGAAAAMLFAPKAGPDMRRDVSASASRLRRAAEEKYGSTADAVGDLVERGRRAVAEGRDAFQAARPSRSSTTTESESGIPVL